MNELIYSSNNEEGLLKSVGPYKIVTAGKSFTGVKLPSVTKFATPIPVGTVMIFGSQLVYDEHKPLPKQGNPLE